MITLSKRLSCIANRVPPGSRLADIGSDHALLPVFLAQRGRVPFAVAGELNPGPYEAARRQVAEAGLARAVEVRRGDGLTVLQPGEVDTVTIAGMGGALIAGILEAGAANGHLSGVRTLILQPNVGEDVVRRWLDGKGWRLDAEDIVEEDGKWYEILSAMRPEAGDGVPDAVYEPFETHGMKAGKELQLKLGPHLLRERSAVFLDKWRSELGKLDRIAAQLSGSNLEASRLKRTELINEIAALRRLLGLERQEM